MKDSTTPNTPRPRILPTAPGWWWVLFLGDPTPRAAYVERVAVPEILDLGPSVLMAGLVGHQTQTSVERDEFTWLARIPTPEQLAAQAAQLAAGQALADHLRAFRPDDPVRRYMEAHQPAFLAAFPPLAASTPPVEEPPSAEVIDLAAALRASMDRKGGAR